MSDSDSGYTASGSYTPGVGWTPSNNSNNGSSGSSSYSSSMTAYNAAQAAAAPNQGPEHDYDSGQAYTPSGWDTARNWFTQNADTVGKVAGTLLGGGLLGTIGGLAGKVYTAYANGDIANGITTYHPDGTVSGYDPNRPTADPASVFGANGSFPTQIGGSGGSGYYSSGGNTVANTSVTGGLAGGAPLTVAQQQALDNSNAARQTAALNRPNQITPYGSQTWTNTPGTDQWSSTITLDPTQQALLDKQNAASSMQGDLATGWLSGVSKNGFPNYQSSVNLNKSLGQATNLSLNTANTPTEIKATAAEAAQAAAERAAGMNLAALADMPTASDADKQRVEQALYSQAMSRLDPLWQQRQLELQTQLANQGITLGSGAYDTSIGQFGRDRNDAYNAALNSAIIGGGAEQTRLFNLGMDVRKQGFAEQSKVADVNVANTQSANQVAIANAANATRAAIANADRELEAARLTAQNKLDSNAQSNAALLAQFNANNSALLNNANFGNTAQLNQMSANNGAAQQVLDAIAQMKQGASPTIPNFASGNSGASVNPVNSAAIAQNDQVAKTARENARAQENNALIAALGGLGSSFLGSSTFSDLF